MLVRPPYENRRFKMFSCVISSCVFCYDGAKHHVHPVAERYAEEALMK